MAARESQDPRAACPSHSSVYAEGVLAPDVLVLTGRFITSETASDLPLYILSDPVTAAPALETGSTGYITITRTASPPQPLFYLTRQSRQPALPSSATTTSTTTIPKTMAPPPPPMLPPPLSPSYSLTALSASLLGNIQLEAPPPPSSASSFSPNRPPASLSAHLHPTGRKTADPGATTDPTDPNPVFFAWMRMRWLSRDEYNYLDADGKQLACEEVAAGGGGGGSDGAPATCRLVVTRALPRVLRDCLVAMWCLRVWMGACEGWGGGGGGGGEEQLPGVRLSQVTRADVTLGV